MCMVFKRMHSLGAVMWGSCRAHALWVAPCTVSQERDHSLSLLEGICDSGEVSWTQAHSFGCVVHAYNCMQSFQSPWSVRLWDNTCAYGVKGEVACEVWSVDSLWYLLGCLCVAVAFTPCRKSIICCLLPGLLAWLLGSVRASWRVCWHGGPSNCVVWYARLGWDCAASV